MYTKTTNGINVTVEPEFLEDESMPENNHYVWSYHITIENVGEEIMQLRSRYWKITDANGISREVEGEGVIGEQPMLAPGESFEYTSGAPLPTPSGIMVGAYQMKSVKGQSVTVDVPAFSLDSPHQNSMLH